jgi:hypothetical protein
LLAALVSQLEADRSDRAPLAGKSHAEPAEFSRGEPNRYRNAGPDDRL